MRSTAILFTIIPIIWVIVVFLKKTFDEKDRKKISRKIEEFDGLDNVTLFKKIHKYFLSLFDKIYRPWSSHVDHYKSIVRNYKAILSHGSFFSRLIQPVDGSLLHRFSRCLAQS